MATRPPATETEISQLLRTERQIPPPEGLATQARMRDFAAEYKRSIDRADDFWADVARELEWFRPWVRVFEWT